MTESHYQDGIRLPMVYDVVYFGQWNNVKENLPNFDQQVLFSDGRYIDIGYRNKYDELYCVSALLIKSLPTHWMPLPNLPEKPNE